MALLPINPDGLASAIREIKNVIKNADGTDFVDVNGFKLGRATLQDGQEVLIDIIDNFDEITRWAIHHHRKRWQ